MKIIDLFDLAILEMGQGNYVWLRTTTTAVPEGFPEPRMVSVAYDPEEILLWIAQHRKGNKGKSATDEAMIYSFSSEKEKRKRNLRSVE